MPDLLVDNLVIPAAPRTGAASLFAEPTTRRLTWKDDTGRTYTLGIFNNNTADVTANAADTYLTGSALAVPPACTLLAGTSFRWKFGMTKTAASTATPVWTVRVGTAGTTSDAAVLTFTGPAQTAVTDNGYVEIAATLRNTGAAGIMAGILTLTHNLDATGFANIGTPTLQTTSSGFVTTTAGLIIGVSVNPGAAGVWTHQVVQGEMLNI